MFPLSHNFWEVARFQIRRFCHVSDVQRISAHARALKTLEGLKGWQQGNVPMLRLVSAETKILWLPQNRRLT